MTGLAYGVPERPEEAYAKVAAMEILLANRRLARRLERAGIATVTCPSDRLAVETLGAYMKAVGGG